MVPRCCVELTCEAALTGDFATGTEASDQVLADGFYHADPHSGNCQSLRKRITHR